MIAKLFNSKKLWSILALVGVLVGSGVFSYKLYNTVLYLEIENERLRVIAERERASAMLVRKQAQEQTNRLEVLTSQLQNARLQEKVAEETVIARDLTETIAADPIGIATQLQEELNVLLQELEELANY